jgi:hypothetical protein
MCVLAHTEVCCVPSMCVLTSVSGQDGNANIHRMPGQRGVRGFRHVLVTRVGVYEMCL